MGTKGTNRSGRGLTGAMAAALALLLAVVASAPEAGAQSEPSDTAEVLPALAAGLPGSCAEAFPGYAPDPVATGETVLADQEIPMSDGTVLRADVHLPTGVDGPFPTVLTITGYNKSAAGGLGFAGPPTGIVAQGYATVLVDDRGTGTSGGEWDSWGERTRADYPEVLDWIVAQGWSDGDIALTGGSYMGITSLLAAATGHPAVKAVFATVPMGDAYRDITFAGGEINSAFIPLWMGLVTGLSLLPSGDPATIFEHLLGITSFQVPTVADSVAGGATAYDGPFWRQRSPIEVADRIQVPTFIVGGLDDLFQRGEPMLYEALADHVDARLLIGPWNHLTTGQGLPGGGVPGLEQLTLQWFDAHVRGLDTGIECIPPVTQYVAGAGRWESAPAWPHPGLHAERWHLRGDGSLTAGGPEAAEAGRSYLQLPVTGVCTRSANQWLIGALGGTPCAGDNSLDESLSLTYTTDPFAADVRIDGPIEADLWIQTAAGSEAVATVAVSSVAPDGTSKGITNGLLLASHRAVDPARARLLDGQSVQPWHPFTAAAQQPVPAGTPMLLPIEVFPTSVVVPAGHRLRLTVAAYDVPHALPPLTAAVGAVGPVTVLNDAAHPSSLVLPVQGARSVTAAPATPEAGPGAGQDGGAGRLPATGGTVPLALAGLALLAALTVRRLQGVEG